MPLNLENSLTIDSSKPTVRNNQQLMLTQGQLTIGRMRRILEENADLSDDTPILYQRIEDKYFDELHWKSTLLPWEPIDWTEEREDFYVEHNIPYQIRESKGKKFIIDLTEYIHASGAYATKDVAGTLALCVHAHY